MVSHFLPYAAVPQLSGFDKAYSTQSPALQPFYHYPPTLAAFAQAIADKQRDRTDRTALVTALIRQYEGIAAADASVDHIRALADERTFTVITAHQPSLFMGPLYFVYKIVTTIRLAAQLTAAYPAYRFVPVFWMGGEDHDFEEINHFRLFGQKVAWESGQRGATGMMDTDTLADALAQAGALLGEGDRADHLRQLLATCYEAGQDYATATFRFVQAWFGKYGLVVAITSHVEWKRLFIPIMEAELTAQPSLPLVEAVQAEKTIAGFKAQAFARPINLFYMKKGMRERIVLENNQYAVLNTELKFTKDEMLAELHAHPQHFSPNVVLRPLYQELIFPNLAYVGGGGELAYWMERKPLFAHFGINMPMLVRRNSVLWVEDSTRKRIEKLGLKAEQLFQELHDLQKWYVHQQAQEALHLAPQKQQLEALFDRVADQAKRVDATLETAVLAEKAKQLKAFDQLESRIARAEKKKHETALNQLHALKDKLFPANGLQERYDNFMPFYLKYGDNFIATLLASLDPLRTDFQLIIE